MIHKVGDRSTIEYDHENNEWIAAIHHVEDVAHTFSAVELTQVVFWLEQREEIDINSYEWANRNGVEQVLVVLRGEESE